MGDDKSKKPKDVAVKGKSKSVPKQMRKRDVKAAKVETKKLDKNLKVSGPKSRSKSVQP